MRLKFTCLLGLLMLGLLSSKVYGGRAGDQGFGLMLGNPSGLSGKYWFSDQVAMDGAAGIAQSEFDIHLSLLFHDFEFLKDRRIVSPSWEAEFPIYIGAGPRFLFADDTEFGLRLPVGISVLPHRTLWEFFLEVAPVIRLTPDAGFEADYAVGARYYFSAIRPKY